MKINFRIILFIAIILVLGIGITYSYFSSNVIGNNDNVTKVTTGKIELEIDDSSITAKDIAPIYDEDYEMLGIHKNFIVASTSSNLNACTKIYLNIHNITDNLKSEYFKYKLIYDDKVIDGNFKNANNNENLLLKDNVFINSNNSKSFDLYIWVSYEDGIDQTNMLGGSVESSLYIEGVDVKEESICK